MATRLYQLNVGDTEFDVVEGAGSPVVSKTIELTIDTGTANIKDTNVSGGLRKIKRGEAIDALELFMNHILSKDWAGD